MPSAGTSLSRCDFHRAQQAFLYAPRQDRPRRGQASCCTHQGEHSRVHEQTPSKQLPALCSGKSLEGRAVWGHGQLSLGAPPPAGGVRPRRPMHVKEARRAYFEAPYAGKE
eukprot:9073842-Alexandrium_andersonii.AAC.1